VLETRVSPLMAEVVKTRLQMRTSMKQALSLKV